MVKVECVLQEQRSLRAKKEISKSYKSSYTSVMYLRFLWES